MFNFYFFLNNIINLTIIPYCYIINVQTKKLIHTLYCNIWLHKKQLAIGFNVLINDCIYLKDSCV